MRKPKYINIYDLMWLAGWLDGEGCFLMHKHSNHKAPAIAVSCTDYDVLKRGAKLMGGGIAVVSKGNYKTVYSFRISGIIATAWMEVLYPFLGERRRCKIAECLDEYYKTRKKQVKFRIKIGSSRLSYKIYKDPKFSFV